MLLFVGLCFVLSAGFNALFGYNSNAGMFAILYAGVYVAFAVLAAWLPLRISEISREHWSGWVITAALVAPLIACVGVSQMVGWQVLGLNLSEGRMERDKKATGFDVIGERLRSARAERAVIGIVKPLDTLEASANLECAKKSRRYPDGVGPNCTRLREQIGATKRALTLDAQISSDAQALKNTDATAGTKDQFAVPTSVINAGLAATGWPAITSQHFHIGFVLLFMALLDVFGTFGRLMVGVKSSAHGWGESRMISEGLIAHPGAGEMMAFQQACLQRAPGTRTNQDDLFAVYQNWARTEGRDVMQPQAVFRLLEAFGIPRKGNAFEGIAPAATKLLARQG